MQAIVQGIHHYDIADGKISAERAAADYPHAFQAMEHDR